MGARSRREVDNRLSSIVDLSKLNDGDLHYLSAAVRNEIRERALRSEDPEVFGLTYLDEIKNAEPGAPRVYGGVFVAVGSQVKYNANMTRHTCTQFSITIPGVEEFWSWEDHGTLGYSQSVKVGDIRQSVAVHSVIDGMRFTRHTMKHDGERHTRINERAWDATWGEDGTEELRIVPVSGHVPRTLPPPNH